MEATVEVLKKPSRAFGALLGNASAKRKFDSGKKVSSYALKSQSLIAFGIVSLIGTL